MLFDPRVIRWAVPTASEWLWKIGTPNPTDHVFSLMWYPKIHLKYPVDFMSLGSLNKNHTHFLGRLLLDLPHETRFLRSWHIFPSTRLLQPTIHCQKVAEIGPFHICIFLQSPPQTSVISGVGSLSHPSECHRSLMLCAYHLCWSSCRVPRGPRSSPWRLGVGDTEHGFLMKSGLKNIKF